MKTNIYDRLDSLSLKLKEIPLFVGLGENLVEAYAAADDYDKFNEWTNWDQFTQWDKADER